MIANSETRRWNELFFQKLPESRNSSFYLGAYAFQNSLKVIKYLDYFLKKQELWKIAQSGYIDRNLLVAHLAVNSFYLFSLLSNDILTESNQDVTIQSPNVGVQDEYDAHRHGLVAYHEVKGIFEFPDSRGGPPDEGETLRLSHQVPEISGGSPWKDPAEDHRSQGPPVRPQGWDHHGHRGSVQWGPLHSGCQFYYSVRYSILK